MIRSNCCDEDYSNTDCVSANLEVIADTFILDYLFNPSLTVFCKIPWLS